EEVIRRPRDRELRALDAALRDQERLLLVDRIVDELGLVTGQAEEREAEDGEREDQHDHSDQDEAPRGLGPGRASRSLDRHGVTGESRLTSSAVDDSSTICRWAERSCSVTW